MSKNLHPSKMNDGNSEGELKGMGKRELYDGIVTLG